MGIGPTMLDEPVGDEAVFLVLCEIQAREYARKARHAREFLKKHPDMSVSQYIDWPGADVYLVAFVLARRSAAGGRQRAEVVKTSIRIRQDVAMCLESLALAGRVEKVERAAKGTKAGDDIVQAFRYRIPAA